MSSLCLLHFLQFVLLVGQRTTCLLELADNAILNALKVFQINYVGRVSNFLLVLFRSNNQLLAILVSSNCALQYLPCDPIG